MGDMLLEVEGWWKDGGRMVEVGDKDSRARRLQRFLGAQFYAQILCCRRLTIKIPSILSLCLISIHRILDVLSLEADIAEHQDDS